MWAAEGAAHAGAAKRRRERRHRAYLKYARVSVAMALSEYKHHTSRGQRMDRAGGWVRDEVHGQVPEEPPGGLPPGCGPGVLAEPRPQERVQRHTMEHIVDLVRVAPMVQILDAQCRRWWTSLQDITRFFDSLLPVPEQVIEVPLCALFCVIRSWWNSWWKCRLVSPSLPVDAKEAGRTWFQVSGPRDRWWWLSGSRPHPM